MGKISGQRSMCLVSVSSGSLSGRGSSPVDLGTGEEPEEATVG